MIRNLITILCGCFSLLRGDAQMSENNMRDRTILELQAAALYVREEATISLDSALFLSAGRVGSSRIAVIAEGLDAAFCDRYGGWIASGNVDSFIRALPTIGRPEQLKATWLIGSWYAFQPGPGNYRKAVEWLMRAKDDAKRAGDMEMEAQSHCLLSKAYYRQGDTVNGNSSYFSVIRDLSFSQLTLQAKARKYVGMYGPFTPQMAKLRMDCLTSALHLYEQLADTGNQVNSLMDIAYQRFAGGDVKGSREAALQSLRLEKAWRFPWSQYTSDLLTYLAEFLGDAAGALKYGLAALDAVEVTDDRYSRPNEYERIARVYNRLNDKTTATDWYKRALHAGLEQNNVEVIYRVLENAAVFQLDLGLDLSMLNTVQEMLRKKPPFALSDVQLANMALGNCNIALHNYPGAQRYYLVAYHLDEQVSAMKGGMKNAYILERLGWITEQLKDYRASRKYLLLLLSPAYEKVTSAQELYRAYEDMHRVDSAYGDYRSAYHYLTLAKRLSEKIYTEAQTIQLLDLNVKYETLQREKLLQISETKRLLEEQREANTRKLFYGGFALLGILITMIYIRYYNNKRKNRKLSQQKREIDAQNEVLHELNDKQTVLLEEKEWLLREIHHRVKNNLQIIASLLSAQSEFLLDRSALRAMADSQHRVKAMSLIHQKLYNSQNLSTVDMAEYIGDLVYYLRESHDLQRKVIFNLDIAKIRLDVSKAVPIGLVLNEAITNAFKYAFLDGDDARMSIWLTAVENLITLEVSDNGHGLPDEFNISQSKSFGMILMRGMAEDLEGNFLIKSDHGTIISVNFMNSAAKALV
jgi:two-component system, sensor histidine kinase PdtaS